MENSYECCVETQRSISYGESGRSFPCYRMEEGRSAFKVLTGKPTGKRPLGRPRRRWEDNIRMELEEIGINGRTILEWILMK